MADRGVSGPWDPQICEALWKGVTQRVPAGFLGALKAPSGARGGAPEANAFWQNILKIGFKKIRYLGRRLHP